MNKKVLFVLFAVLMMAVLTVSVSADQLANDRWCNSDEYGCWVTGEEGEQIYIMFWSEEAREFFMGPGSNAPVVEPYPAGRMSLEAYPVTTRYYTVKMVKPSEEQLKEISEMVSSDEGKDMVCTYNDVRETVTCRSAEDAAKYPYCTPDGSSCFDTKENLDRFLSGKANTNTNTEANTNNPPAAQNEEPMTRDEKTSKLYDYYVENGKTLKGDSFNEEEYMKGFEEAAASWSEEDLQKRLEEENKKTQLTEDLYNYYVEKGKAQQGDSFNEESYMKGFKQTAASKSSEELQQMWDDLHQQ